MQRPFDQNSDLSFDRKYVYHEDEISLDAITEITKVYLQRSVVNTEIPLVVLYELVEITRSGWSIYHRVFPNPVHDVTSLR